MWIGTLDGLNCFNGYETKIYKKIPGDSTSLPNNNIQAIYVDKKGRLWVATNPGLSVYNRETDAFVRVAHENYYAGLRGINVRAFDEDKTGNFYTGGYKSIYKLDEIAMVFNEIVEIEQGEIMSFVFDENDNIWIGTEKDGGLLYFDRQNNLL